MYILAETPGQVSLLHQTQQIRMYLIDLGAGLTSVVISAELTTHTEVHVQTTALHKDHSATDNLLSCVSGLFSMASQTFQNT